MALVLFLLTNAGTAAAVDRAMTTRFSANDTGNIAFAANTLMVCPASATTPAPGCTAARALGPVSSGNASGQNNNGYDMQYVNTTPGTVPGQGASFDSSSATLSLPPTATVLFAGLYWGGDTSGGSNPPTPADSPAPNPSLNNRVGFRGPGDSGYAAVIANQLDISSGSATRYGAFADVTSKVAAAGPGTYSVANVQTGKGGDRFAGWTLVVAYRDTTQPPRNLTVDDGLITINSSAPPTTIPIGGFRTPPSGAVRTTLGFVALEGDSGLSGDSATLNGTRLTDGANPPNNFFNGGISNLGTNVTTRNPNDVNNWDYDSKLISANGILPNNATTANVVVTTNGDTYYPQVVTLATDLYAPNITSTKSVANITHPSGPDQRGDVLRYTVSYKNTGADSATNFIMRDPIPGGSTYVPGSLRIDGVPQSDALGDDAAEFNSGSGEVVFRLGAGGNATTGGTIVPGQTVTATFDVKIDAGDIDGQQIVNQATATFTGATLGIPFTDVSPQVVDTVAVPTLTIAKSHAGVLVGGQATTFTLAVSNVGSAPTDGSTVTVTDPFPASSFTSLANAGGTGWNCSIAGLTLTCTRSDVLAAGDSYPPISVDATVSHSANGNVSNTASVSGGGSSTNTGSDVGGASQLADLSVTKSVQPGTVARGGQVTYSLNVQNSGPSDAQNVTVSDALDPASSTDVKVQTTQGSCNTTISCSLGTVDASSNVTITITATVTRSNTTLTNTASVSSPTPDPTPSNNTSSTSVTVPPTADLSIAKSASPDNPLEGTPDTFTITVTNHGPDAAANVVVNDTLPSEFTAATATGGGFSCAINAGAGGVGGTIVCTRASLSVSDGPQAITISGAVAPGSAAHTIVNAATVHSDTADPNLDNNTATVNQLITPAADVSITKRALQSDDATPLTTPVSVGGSFDYQLVVTNSGPSAAVGVVVTDTLPAGMTLAATVPGCVPGAGSSGLITCTVGGLAVGASDVINLNVNVGVAAANSAPTNSAAVTSATPDPNPSDNSASATVGVGAVANLSVLKSVSTQTAKVGDLLTYTLAVTNNTAVGEAGPPSGTLGTTGAVVTDPLPAGLQFVSSSTCTEASGTVTCHVGPVAQGQIVTASYTARVTPAAAGSRLDNRATVATEAAGGFSKLPDYDPHDDTDAATLAVDPQADVSLTKTVSPSNPGPDDEVTFTLAASNHGPNDATGVTIHDSLPSGLDFIEASPGCDNAGGNVTCDLGTIASGGEKSVAIRAHTTLPLAGTSVGNGATVTANEPDPDPSNNTASATIHLKPLVADLTLTKVASNPSPTVGGPVTYGLAVVNNGPNDATGLTISDPLPSGLTFVSATSGQGSCGASGQTVTCHLGSLAAGGATLVKITANVAASAAGKALTNTATASANETIGPPAMAQATITPVGGPPPATADLAITKKVNHTKARTGDKLTYTLTVTNHGPATASSPTVTDTFSAPVSVVSVHTSSGSCSKGRVITCKLGSMASGASDEITIVAKPTVPGHLRNAASVTSSTPDPNPGNNTAHVTTNVRPGPAGLRLTKTASPTTVRPGRSLSFTIAVRSLGPQPALGVQVCDQLGSGMVFISVDHASFHHGIPCWKTSSLAKGKVRRFVVRVRALPSDRPGKLTNVATASAEGVRTRTVRATVAVVGAAPPPPPGGVTG